MTREERQVFGSQSRNPARGVAGLIATALEPARAREDTSLGVVGRCRSAQQLQQAWN